MTSRDKSILTNIDYGSGRYLEIGPLHRPLLSKNDTEVYYLDHCSTTELRKKYSSDTGVPSESIVEVDIVVDDGSISTNAKKYAPYAGIVASHVVEHVPNLIKWFKEIWELLEIGGVLYLAAPDKRYTFDILRRSSTLKDITEAYNENRWRPSLDIVCDSYRNSVGLDSQSIWNGSFNLEYAAVGWPSKTVNEFIEKYLRGDYVDVHCWIFTPWEFISLIGKIIDMYHIPFDLVYFRNTLSREEEFHVQLKKRSNQSELSTNWSAVANDALVNSNWPDGSFQDKFRRIREMAKL